MPESKTRIVGAGDTSGLDPPDQPSEQKQALRPVSEPGHGVDVPELRQFAVIRVPGLGKFPGACWRHKSIVRRCNDQRGHGKLLPWHWQEIACRERSVGAFEIGRCDQQRSLHAAGRVARRPVRGERAGEAMADQDCGARTAGKGGIEPTEPRCEHRFVPVVLQDACSVTKGEAPIGLPMIDAGIAQAGQHKKIKFGCGVAHGIRRLLNGA